jgi:photosystem II stability/assembly factor-like uncharacterized protein
MLRAVLARLAILTVLVLAGCGGSSDDPAATSTPTAPAPTSSATPGAQTSDPPPTSTSGANAFIGSIAVDPSDGTVMLGTGLGLFRLDKGAKDAKRVTGQLSTPSGSGSVSGNVVVSYAGPGNLMGSGHPEGGSLPENLGVIRSEDHGNTWASVSELGRTDYHILEASDRHVVGVLAEAREVRVSDDGGASFEDHTLPDMPRDVAFDPRDPKRMVAATEQGTYTSQDAGRSWRQRENTAAEQLAWGETLYRADPGGAIKSSSDGGVTWKDAGTVDTTVNSLAVDAGGAVYAGVVGGEVKRSTDGGATWTRLVKLK